MISLRGFLPGPVNPHAHFEELPSKSSEDPTKDTFPPSANFPRMVRRSGSVPVFSAAALLGASVTNSHAAALALSALARYGECGLRRLRDAVSMLPIVPTFSEHSNGRLPDVLPLHPRLVKTWVNWRGKDESFLKSGAIGSLVKESTDALHFL